MSPELAQTTQDSITMKRLPMPEPTVFSGEPIHFIERKASFMTLIDQKGISAADKLNYFKKCVIGPARTCLEGTFFRNDGEAYQDAWKNLSEMARHLLFKEHSDRSYQATAKNTV